MLDLTQQRFGRLLAKTPAKNLKGKRAWECLCDCGNMHTVKTNYLTSGAVKSCGCWNKDHPPRLLHGKSNTRIYSIFAGMHRRCTDIKHAKSMLNYISRGITVCDEWQDVLVFEKWALSSGYKNTLTLDRIDGNGNYEPSNCRWATPTTQSRNRRKTKGTSSKYIGVYYNKVKACWGAQVTVGNQSVFHKTYRTELEAAEARDLFINTNNLEDFSLNLR